MIFSLYSLTLKNRSSLQSDFIFQMQTTAAQSLEKCLISYRYNEPVWTFAMTRLCVRAPFTACACDPAPAWGFSDMTTGLR